MERDAQAFGHGLAFGDQVVEQLAGGRKPRRRAVMQQRQRADRIGGRVENQFGPLRAARIFQGNGVHARTVISPASSSTLLMEVWVGSKGPIQVSPLMS